MKALRHYIDGSLIGIIIEYCFRVKFGYLQAFILILLISKAIITIYDDFKTN